MDQTAARDSVHTAVLPFCVECHSPALALLLASEYLFEGTVGKVLFIQIESRYCATIELPTIQLKLILNGVLNGVQTNLTNFLQNKPPFAHAQIHLHFQIQRKPIQINKLKISFF